MTFLEVPIAGDEHRFVERTIRIAPIPAAEAGVARASMLAAIPARTGRVIWRAAESDGNAGGVPPPLNEGP